MRKPRHRAVSSGADANQESPILALLLKESPGILGSTFGGVSMCGLERWERLLEVDLNKCMLGGFSDYGNLPSGSYGVSGYGVA